VIFPFRGPKYVVDKDTSNSARDKSDEPPQKKTRPDTTDTGA